jgi:hypothetical protein
VSYRRSREILQLTLGTCRSKGKQPDFGHEVSRLQLKIPPYAVDIRPYKAWYLIVVEFKTAALTQWLVM